MRFIKVDQHLKIFMMIIRVRRAWAAQKTSQLYRVQSKSWNVFGPLRLVLLELSSWKNSNVDLQMQRILWRGNPGSGVQLMPKKCTIHNLHCTTKQLDYKVLNEHQPVEDASSKLKIRFPNSKSASPLNSSLVNGILGISFLTDSNSAVKKWWHSSVETSMNWKKKKILHLKVEKLCLKIKLFNNERRNTTY